MFQNKKMEAILESVQKVKEIRDLTNAAGSRVSINEFLDELSRHEGNIKSFIQDIRDLEDDVIYSQFYYSLQEAQIMHKCLDELIQTITFSVVLRVDQSMKSGENFFDPNNFQDLMSAVTDLQELSSNVIHIQKPSEGFDMNDDDDIPFMKLAEKMNEVSKDQDAA